jgi:hypothetical protein
MKISTRSRSAALDLTDRDHLRQTLSTRGYQIIQERMEEMLEAARLKLESMEGADLLKQQGRVAMLREILRLPDAIAEQISRGLEHR